MKRVFLLLCGIIFLISCDDYDGKLKLINQTQRTVFFYRKIGVNEKLRLPDCDDFEKYKKENNVFMKNLDTARLIAWGTWESALLEKDTLVILLFDSSKFELHCRGEIPIDSTYNEYSFNKEYMIKNNWTIIINELPQLD